MENNGMSVCEKMAGAIKMRMFDPYNVEGRGKFIAVESKECSTIIFTIKFCPFCGKEL